MDGLGAPTIRVAESAYGYVAIEGCHRLEAAFRVGIDPIFEIVEMDQMIIDHGFQDFEDEPMLVSEIIEYIGIPEGAVYEFNF